MSVGMKLSEDPTLDEVRSALAPHIPSHAAFDGWTVRALDAAAGQIGIDPALARLAFDAEARHGGPGRMIDAWFDHIDDAMAQAVPAEELATMGVTGRIRRLVTARLDLVHRDREALRRALAILALPQNIGLAARLGWRTVDRIWRQAGDKSVDFSFYTRRATLGAVYSATILTFLDDESDGMADTRAFLDRRLADVGRFEKAKAQLRARGENRPSLARFVGRLRYPAR